MFVLRTLRIVWLSLATLIVALAVMLSAVRLLLPGMSEYKAQIQTVAQNFLQRPVDIGTLDAAWRGLSPVLRLNEVVIEDQQFPDGELKIAEVEVALDVIGSLIHRKWMTAGVRFIGIDFSLETDLRARRSAEWGREAFNWLLQQESITLEQLDVDWTDTGLFEQSVQLTNLSVKLVNEGRRHHFLLETDLPARFGERLRFAADLDGHGVEIQDWQGRIYLKTEDLALDALEGLFAELPLSVNGRMDVELWAGIRGAQLEWGSGSYVIHDAVFENRTADAQGIGADRLSSSFFVQSTDKGWGLGLRKFQLQRDNRVVWPWSTIDLSIETEPALRVRGNASRLVLDELHSLTPLLPWVDAEALSMLDRLEPEGLLREAEFELEYREGQAPRFSARAKIEDLQFAAHAGLPGLSGLSGRLEGNLQSGYLHLDSDQASLRMPQVFPSTLDLTDLRGVVRWQRYANLFRIESQRLRVNSGELGVLARWQLDWSYDEPSPWLDMQLALDDFPLSRVRQHLPEKIMPPRAVAWLKRAFVAGTATDARVLFQGRADKMPFDNEEGRFEARFGFDNVVLDYDPAWGGLYELDGTAVFSGRSMTVTATQGRLQDSPIKRVVAVIKDLKRPLLQIEGTAGGTLPAMLGYVRNSPLNERFGGFAEKIDAGGDARLQLELRIPLARQLGEVEVSGLLVLDNNELILKREDIRFTDIQGTLVFTQEGASANALRARILNRPVAVSVYQRQAATGATTVVDVRGELGFIEMLSDFSALQPHIDGSTNWQASLQIRNQPQAGRPALELHLRSDLRGVSIDLPYPFSKSAAELREFRLVTVPGQEHRHPIRIKYGDRINARVLMTADKRGLSKAAIRFDGGPAEIPEWQEIRLSGYLEELDLGRWISVFGAAKGGGGKVLPLTVDLAVGNLLLAGVQVKGVRAESNMPDPWHYQVQGEGASGWLRWFFADRANPARIMAKLQRLVLTSRGGEKDLQGSTLAQPTKLPEMDINIGDLDWDERKLGSISLLAKRSRYGLSFETLDMHSKAISFKGQGAWLEVDGQQTTRFNAAVDGGELGELTQLLGTDSAIKGGKLSGDIAADWPGPPADFSLATVKSELDLQAESGRLLSVDKAGAGKLLSLFSLNSLQRRLTLDFTDIYKEGFSFDKMKGRFLIKEGDAVTNDFTIKGTSATIEVAGRTGLVARDYDQLVTVTPQVSSTLPIAGAIAGGPVVGAAVFLADKLVGDKFNRITRVRYRVTGSWDDPVYEQLQQEDDRTDELVDTESDEP
jgi:uncharacterized protein (TIGR02099 family)